MTKLARAIDTIPIVADAAERALLFPTPDLDQRVYRKDARGIERYVGGGTWQNDLSLNDGIPVVADAAARTALFPSPDIGQRVHRLDTKTIERWNGTVWEVAMSADSIARVLNATDRDTQFTAPVTGQRVYRADTGAIEEYSGSAWTIIFDRSRVINVASRGAGTGVAGTDTPIIQAALAEALADPFGFPKALYFPHLDGGAHYALNGELPIRGIRGFLCFGDGAYASQLWWEGTGGEGTCMWRLEDTNYCTFRDLFLRFNGQAESAFLVYNNAARSGITPNNNSFHNIYIDGINSTLIDFGWNFAYMPSTPAVGTVAIVNGAATFTTSQQNNIGATDGVTVVEVFGDGTLSAAAGTGTFSLSQANKVANNMIVYVELDGTVDCRDGILTFSQSQAGVLSAGMSIVLETQGFTLASFNGTTGGSLNATTTFFGRKALIGLTLSAFNGTTGATLSGNPTFSARPFKLIFSNRSFGNGEVTAVAGAATFTHDMTGVLANGSVIRIDGVDRTISAFAGTTATLSGAPTLTSRPFTITSGGTSDYKKGMLIPIGLNVPFGNATARSFVYRSGVDQNNDLSNFYGCVVNQYKVAGWRIGHSQSKQHRLVNCEWQGGGTGVFGILQINGSFRALNCNGGGNRGDSGNGADVHLSNPMDNIVLDGLDMEGSNRLLSTSNGSGSGFPVEVRACRLSSAFLHADGFIIDYRWSGPLIITGGQIGEGNETPHRIKVGGTAFSCRGVNFSAQNSASTLMFDFAGMTPGAEVYVGENSYADGGGLVVDYANLPANTVNPIVQFGYAYRTQNTAATVYRDFRGGHPNQKITITFMDAVSSVQSGGSIQLNGMTNWGDGTTTGAIPKFSTLTLVYDHVGGVWHEVGRTSGAAPQNITDLVAAIEAATGGSPGCVWGVYDTRYNLDVNAGRVVAWSDARGARTPSGADRANTFKRPASATGPAWDNTNKYITGSEAAGEYLEVGANGATLGITGGNMGIAAVGEFTNTGVGYVVGISKLSTADVQLQLKRGDGAGATVEAEVDLAAFDSGDVATAVGTRQLAIARRTQSGGNAVVAVSVDNGAESASASTADAAVSVEYMTVGAFARQQPATNLGTFKVRAVIILSVEPTAAIRTVIRNWSNAQHGTP